MSKDNSGPRRYSAFVPVLLTLLVLWAMLGMRHLQLREDRDLLRERRTGLQETLRGIDQAREQLDALGAGLTRLAAGGNANAQTLIKRLEERGITLEAESNPRARTTTPGFSP